MTDSNIYNKMLAEAEQHLKVGRRHRLRGEFAQAQRPLQLALRRFTDLGLSQGQAETHLELGALDRRRDERSLAMQHLDIALKSFVDLDDELGQAHAHLELGILLCLSDDHRLSGATEHLQAALHQYTILARQNGQATSHLMLGIVADQRFERDTARHHLNAALALAEENVYNRIKSHTHRRLGVLERQYGSLSLAQHHLDAALAMARQVGQVTLQLDTLIELGTLAWLRDNFPAAERALGAALMLIASVGSQRLEIDTHNRLGRLHHDRGNLDTARGHLDTAIILADEIDYRRGQAHGHLALGALACQRDDLDSAKDNFDAALHRFSAFGDLSGVAAAHGSLGILALRRSDLATAGQHLDTALRLYTEIDHRLGQANVLEDQGLLLAELGQSDEALELLGEAADRFEGLGMASQLARTCELAGRLVEDPVVRLGWLVRGVGAVEGLRASQVSGVEADFWQERFAGLYVECLRSTVDAQDAGAGLWVMEAVRARRVAGLLAASRDGRVLPEQAAAVMAEIDQIGAELAALQPPPSDPDGAGGPSWRSLPMPGSPDLDINPEARAARVAALHTQLDVLHDQLAEATSDGFAQLWDPTVLEVDQLVAVVRDGTDVVAFHVEGTEVWTVWVDPERTPAAIQHLDLDEHPRLAAQLERFAAHDPASWDGHDPDPQHLDPLRDLFPDALLELWQHQTPGAPPRRLLLIPSGPLWAVPFAAVPIDPDRLLIDVTDLAATPTLRIGHHTSAVDQHLLPTDARILGCAHPDFTRDLEQPAELFANFHHTDTDLAGQLHQSWDAAALPAHGNHQPGLAHTLDFHTTRLTAADLLGRPTPTTLHLAACAAGYTPGHHPTEPYGIPTIALTHGTHTIYTATTLLQDHPTTHHILDHLWHLATTEDGPPERHLAHLQRTRPPHTPLLAWAPLTTHTTR